MSKSPVSEGHEDDASSLAHASDFNRSPGYLPAGAKKWWFPDVYPKYADKFSVSNSNYFSSPGSDKGKGEI